MSNNCIWWLWMSSQRPWMRQQWHLFDMKRRKFLKYLSKQCFCGNWATFTLTTLQKRVFSGTVVEWFVILEWSGEKCTLVTRFLWKFRWKFRWTCLNRAQTVLHCNNDVINVVRCRVTAAECSCLVICWGYFLEYIYLWGTRYNRHFSAIWVAFFGFTCAILHAGRSPIVRNPWHRCSSTKFLQRHRNMPMGGKFSGL